MKRKITYTLIALLLFLGLKAQETTPTQVVAIGAKMSYSVGVVSPVDGTDYTYFWDLLNSDGVSIHSETGSSSVTVPYKADLVEAGKTYRLTAYVKREGLCSSDATEIFIKVVAAPIVSFKSDDLSDVCSFSSKNAIQQAEFDVYVDGYTGEGELEYSVIDPDGNEVSLENNTVHISNKEGKISIVLGDTYVNNSDEDVEYKVVLKSFAPSDEGIDGPVVLSPDNANHVRKIIISPAVKIGTIISTTN